LKDGAIELGAELAISSTFEETMLYSDGDVGIGEFFGAMSPNLIELDDDYVLLQPVASRPVMTLSNSMCTPITDNSDRSFSNGFLSPNLHVSDILNAVGESENDSNNNTLKSNFAIFPPNATQSAAPQTILTAPKLISRTSPPLVASPRPTQLTPKSILLTPKSALPTKSTTLLSPSGANNSRNLVPSPRTTTNTAIPKPPPNKSSSSHVPKTLLSGTASTITTAGAMEKQNANEKKDEAKLDEFLGFSPLVEFVANSRVPRTVRQNYVDSIFKVFYFFEWFFILFVLVVIVYFYLF
jgi:hypothetical protein